MPHQSCTVCKRKDLEAINADCGSVRKVAKRFGLSPAALDRHRHHSDHAKNRVNSGQLKQIDDEIQRLKRAQTAARKRRDSAAFVRLSGELRQWHVLKAKIHGATLPEKDAPAAAVSERDLLVTGMAIIEANLTGDRREQVCEWLTTLVDRLRPATDSADLLEGATVSETDTQLQISDSTES